MNSLLTRGLRKARLRDGGAWPELVTKAIQGQWPAPAASSQTLEAERGLGIRGKPYYFYVLRAEDSYGLVVFVLSEAENAVWPADARGATPFDSGGWWLGMIHTDPPLDTAARQGAFQTLDVPLHGWQDAFEQYIHAHYDTISDYIDGRAPEIGNQPLEMGFTIVNGLPNTARAWTWEVRVPHDLIADRLTLRAIYMSEVSRDDYIDWLWRSPLADSESRRIDRWFSDHVVVAQEQELVLRAVRGSMALEAGRG